MKAKKITLALLLAMVYLGCAAMFLGHTQISQSERRELTQWSKVLNSSLADGSFMTAAEDAAMDQFPFRDQFRSLKANFLYHGLKQLDNNGIYIYNGSAGRLDYPLNESSVSYAIARIESIVNRYLTGTNTNAYYCIVPDKNYYMAQELGYPVMDYKKLAETLSQSLSVPSIDIFDLLTADSYYKTDPHWDQSHIQEVAKRLAQQMGTSYSLAGASLETAGTLSGAYVGQSALSLKPDVLAYWDGGILEQCKAYDLSTGAEIPIYDFEGLAGNDPYDFFMGGAAPLQVIENPNCSTGKELIIFRDSFGSSIAPLLAGSYSRITLVDTRYINSTILGQYIQFDDQDVLFLYSTLILNSSSALK